MGRNGAGKPKPADRFYDEGNLLKDEEEIAEMKERIEALAIVNRQREQIWKRRDISELPKSGRDYIPRYLKAMRDAITPEEMEENIRVALGFAIKQESHRGVLEILKFVSDYNVGKPSQKIDVGFGGRPEDWMRAFADNNDEIEGEYSYEDAE